MTTDAGALIVSTDDRRGSIGVAILRITLGVIILATWWSNVTGDPNFYSADSLRGFFGWLFQSAEEGGNGSSLGFVESIIDGTVLQAPGLFGFLQMVVEFFIGVGLLIGGFTRLFSALAFAFFVGLFLSYFGGEEWIWTYVILMAASLTVFLNYGGRQLGVDRLIAAARGNSPLGLLW